MTSKAERRSLTTKSKVSPRSKTSRTLPLRSFLIPGSSISRSACIALTIVAVTFVGQALPLAVVAAAVPSGRISGLVCRQTAAAAAFGSRHGCPTIVVMAGIVVRPRARILHGHDWVFSSEVLKVFGNPADGDVISIKDGRDRMLGSAIYNSKSQIVARRFSRRKQDLDLDFFKRRIAQAAEYRERRKVDPKLRRVVWSESDGLPGVIVDRYADHFVLQTLTLAMDMRKDLIVNAMIDLFGEKITIIERNEAPVRKAEGLDLRTGVLEGAALSAPITIEITAARQRASLQFEIDLLGGQKTGFYLDQRQNYEIVAQHANSRRVLDCFTNQGAFALACARQGASEVTGVEENSQNIAAAKKNAERNALSINFVEQDVFQFLRAAERAEA